MIDYGAFNENRNPEVSAVTLSSNHELLLKGEKLIGEVSWDELWLLADKAHEDGAENGIKLRLLQDGVKTKQFVGRDAQGSMRNRHSIKPPSEPNYGDRKFHTVFIHTHPDSDSSMERMSWLVSGWDNGASLLYLAEGGMSTIADREGFTTLISADSLDSETDPAYRFQAVWSNPLLLYYDNMDAIVRFVDENKDIGNRNSNFIFEVRDLVFGVKRKYLRIGRDSVNSSGISLDELCFDDGLVQMMDYLSVGGTSCEPNIGMALKN